MDKKLITLKLSEDQRSALLKYQQDLFDPDIARLLSLALKKDDTYEIYLTEDQLEFLHDDLCRIANHTESKKTQREVDKLWQYLEEYMIALEEEE